MKYEEWRSFESEIEMLKFIKGFSSDSITEMRIGHAKQSRNQINAFLGKAIST